MGRFKDFTEIEKSVLHDGLISMSEIDPKEDPTFPPLVEAAEKMYDELVEDM